MSAAFQNVMTILTLPQYCEALDQGFLVKDSALRVKVPGQLKQTDKTTLSWDQLRRSLDELSAMDRFLVELDMTNAFRPSELFALRWKCFDAKHPTLTLGEAVYKGKIRNWGKTAKSLSAIHLAPGLVPDLSASEKVGPDSSPEAFIFPHRDGGFRDADNYRKRVLHDLAEKLGLLKLTFQVIRRTVGAKRTWSLAARSIMAATARLKVPGGSPMPMEP